MNVECWREKLAALDLVRECSVPTSEDSCWLCDDLEAWNRVLQPLKLHLYNTWHGVLNLRTRDYKVTAEFEELDTPYDTTFFTVWLPKKHHCVVEVNLNQNFQCFRAVSIPDSVARSPSHLRRISIDGDASFDWSLLLDALGPIEQLEELRLDEVMVSNSLASTVAQLLLANADSMKAFCLSVTSIPGSSADILMSGISKCGKLRELTFYANLGLAGAKDFAMLLRTTETLEKLSVIEQRSDGVPDDEEINYEKNNEEILTAVGDLLSRNSTLTELAYRTQQHLIVGILNILETNNVLRCLTITTTYMTDSTEHDHRVGTALKSMLTKNTVLRSLILEDFDINYDFAGPVSEGLQQNTTLECIDLYYSTLSFCALEAFCSVLGINRTLSSLKVGYHEGNFTERRALSAELAKTQCYGRLQMFWNHWDAPGLSAALLELSVCPTQLGLDTGIFTREAFSAVCNAVASSVRLKELKVHFRNTSTTRVDSLFDALCQNKSLEHVILHEDTNCEHFVGTAAASLHFNKSVAQLEAHCSSVDELSAMMIASLISSNESIWRLQLYSKVEVRPACKDIISSALVENQFITFCFPFSVCHDDSFATVEEAQQRNFARLRQAARFVMRQNTDKVCAEAFEHFKFKPQLLTCLMNAASMTEAEAHAAVSSAVRFIGRNYLFINQVVCCKVECHAGEGTQIDQLNDDCWLAITKYLKVSDIEKRYGPG